MSKRNGGTEETIKKWIMRGDGQGEGLDYQPFLKVSDVPSRGRSHKIKGLKFGRVQHYLSDLEYYHHIIHEFDPMVLDIREQYALLPREETQEIAEELGVKHPVYPEFQTPIVMTSDLVITRQNTSSEETKVIAVKYASEIDPKNSKSERTYEKLLIEKIFWGRKAATWELSTEKDISINMALNLDMLRVSMLSEELDFLNVHMDLFVSKFHKYWTPFMSLNEILFLISKDINIKNKHSFCLFGRAIWMHRLNIDLVSECIAHSYPVRLIDNNIDNNKGGENAVYK